MNNGNSRKALGMRLKPIHSPCTQSYQAKSSEASLWGSLLPLPSQSHPPSFSFLDPKGPLQATLGRHQLLPLPVTSLLHLSEDQCQLQSHLLKAQQSQLPPKPCLCLILPHDRADWHTP